MNPEPMQEKPFRLAKASPARWTVRTRARRVDLHVA